MSKGAWKVGAEARFWLKVQKTPSCWNWTGAGTKRRGVKYGGLWINGSLSSAHRFSYELANGPIPAGYVVDHLCRNTLCVNPGHLEAVTVKENTLRGVGASAQNKRKVLCKRGHNAWSIKNGNQRECLECKKNAGAARYLRAKEKARALGVATNQVWAKQESI